MNLEFDDDRDEGPLDAGAASLPETLGGGCLTRFDPQQLNEDMGADFSDVQVRAQGS